MKYVLFDSFDLKIFEDKIRNAYTKHEKVRFIFDFSSKDFTLTHLLKGQPILEKYREHTKTKLDKSIIIAPHTWQRILIRLFLFILRPERPVEICHELSLK